MRRGAASPPTSPSASSSTSGNADLFTWTSLDDEAVLLDEASRSERVAVEMIGESVNRNPIRLVRLGTLAAPAGTRAAVLLVGSQHGDEPAGREAILRFVAGITDSLDRDLAELLDRWPVVAVPTTNPDGIDTGSRWNANDVDLNRDHVAQVQPETRALHSVLARTRPLVVLDMHESRKHVKPDSLVEFSRGHHPRIHPRVTVASQTLLDRLLARATAHAYPTGEYESGTADDARSLRNAAALNGHVAALTESNANHDGTPGRAARVKAQLAALDETLRHATEHAAELVQIAGDDI
ncbi:MAG: M14 family zinc carboxypeptidase [bacterium]